VEIWLEIGANVCSGVMAGPNGDCLQMTGRLLESFAGRANNFWSFEKFECLLLNKLCLVRPIELIRDQFE
jgi:hypothetical protein